MKKLYVTRGLLGSGKSTWAKKKAAEESNTVIVNRDKIREMLKGEYQNFPFGSKMEKLVTQIEYTSITYGLANKYNVIIDATNFKFDEKFYLKRLEEYKLYPIVEIVDFTHVSVEECIRRDSLRDFPVGEKIIRRMNNRYL